ncbi:MAG: hypothetical protein LBC38_04225 [Oscillospiraceae bacterium]|jgi:processive 1,2-diacylglycerol beta-glucosyltransferase|nr:hypothetical protein [Oscillospiraceae bacterium]
MRVLIVSVTTGGGHNSTADAIEAEFQRLKESGAEIEIEKEDFYEYVGDFFYNVMDKGYQLLITHFSEVFGKSYDTFETDARLRRAAATLSGSEFMANRFGSYFRGNSPDIIITTHVFAASALSDLKAKGRITAPIIGIMTDYCIHPFWEDCKFTDYIVIPDKLFEYAAMKRGISNERLLPLGIPVRQNFLSRMDKSEAREKLGFEREALIVLVMGGAMGYGNIQEVVEEILETDDRFHVAVICGNNKRLLNNLQKIENSNLHTFGFVSNVDEFMDAADCIITKPGGLTSTEFLIKNLPAILINPIPGPEKRNMQFFCNSGCALHSGKNFSIHEALAMMFDDPDKLGEMRKALQRVAKPKAAYDICQFAINLVNSSAIEGGTPRNLLPEQSS